MDEEKNRLASVGRLCDIVARLRGPGGCPWDGAQTHVSLKPACIEEAAEVIGGIDILCRDAMETMIDAPRNHPRRIVVGRDDRDLIAVLEAEEPRLRRGITRKAVVAVEMVGAEVRQHRDVAG